ncbi:hypothetical protein A5657_20095 [Mycobacterium kubicae]|nr:hypothetical protein A5657_20095 [Mycobacterium kubicae]
MERMALVARPNDGVGSPVCDRLRADGVPLRTIDAVRPADAVTDLSVDTFPFSAVTDIAISVSVAGVGQRAKLPVHLRNAPALNGLFAGARRK